MLYSRFALVVALVVGLPVGTVAAQIPGIPRPSGVGGEYRSDVTGSVIGWTSDWMLGTKDVQEILRYDQTMLFSPADRAIVDIFVTAQDLEAASMRDGLIEGVSEGEATTQIVNSGDYGDIAYALVTLAG